MCCESGKAKRVVGSVEQVEGIINMCVQNQNEFRMDQKIRHGF